MTQVTKALITKNERGYQLSLEIGSKWKRYNFADSEWMTLLKYVDDAMGEEDVEVEVCDGAE